MSGRLVRDVLQYAPEDLNKTELLVLIALAEDARDTDRIARFITIDQIADRARISSRTTRNVLARLRSRFLITGTVHRPGNGRRQLYQVAFLTAEHRSATLGRPVKVDRRPRPNGHKVGSLTAVTQLHPEQRKVGSPGQ